MAAPDEKGAFEGGGGWPERVAQSDSGEMTPPDTDPRVDGSSQDLPAVMESTALFLGQFVGIPPLVPREWLEHLHAMAANGEMNRRYSTLLSIDVSGFARLRQTHGANEHDQMVHWIHEVVSRHVHFHGGFLIRFQGDGVLASFGAPWSFAGSAVSAARAALGVRTELEQQAKQLNDGKVPVRMGMHFGPVSVRLVETHGQQRVEVYGSAVAEATLMESQAAAWEIRVSRRLATLLVANFRLDVVQGTAEDEEASEGVSHRRGGDFSFKLLGARSHTVGAMAITTPHQGSIVARAEEIARIESAVAAAANRQFAALWLTGPSGVGRSRVVQHGFASRPAGMRSLMLRVTPECAHWPLSLVVAILSHLGYNTQDPERLLQDIHRRCVSLSPAARDALGETFGHHDMTRPLPLREAAIAMSEVLTSEAGREPFVLMLAGFRNADRSSVDAITSLIERRPNGLALVISSSRRPPEAQQDRWEVLPFPALDEETSLRLLDSLDWAADLSSALRTRLVTESGGIPLCLVEMSREAAMSPPEAPAERFRDVLRLDIPPRLLDVLQGEVDALAPLDRVLMQLCALIGPRFIPLDANLMRMTQELLPQACVLKGLRPPSKPPTQDQIAVFYRRSLSRGVAYGMLTGHQRRRLHHRVAERIAKWHQPGNAPTAMELAFHFARAEQPEQALAAVQEALDSAGEKREREACLALVEELGYGDRTSQ